jgi:tetratricopeptide (TPR) repeat protein
MLISLVGQGFCPLRAGVVKDGGRLGVPRRGIGRLPVLFAGQWGWYNAGSQNLCTRRQVKPLPLKGVVLSVAVMATVQPSFSSGQFFKIKNRKDLTDGLAALDKKDFAGAIELFNKAIERNPASAFAHLGRAVAYQSLGEFDTAIDDFDQAIRVNPRLGLVFASRGEAWHAKGDYEKALADFDEAIVPKTGEAAFNSRAWLRATCPDEKFRDGAKAIEDATESCELTDWMNAEFLDTLAAAYAEAGNFDEAVELQKRAIEHAPENNGFENRLKLYQEAKPYREEPRK